MKEYLKDPEFVARRIAKRLENKKTLQEFFVHIGPILRVTRDKYNITLIEKRTSEEGNTYISPVGYFTTLQGMIPLVAKEKGATEEAILRYKEKVEGICVEYKEGVIVLKLPEGFKADPVDINPDDDGE